MGSKYNTGIHLSFTKLHYCDQIGMLQQWFKKGDYNRELIRKDCFGEIDKNWNPSFQMDIIKKII